jgi:hypothetical protein
MKAIAGPTVLRDALQKHQAGFPNIRGRVAFEAERKNITVPSGVLNIVHVPDPQRVTFGNRYLSGRLTDLDVFVNLFDVGKALYSWRKKKP